MKRQLIFYALAAAIAAAACLIFGDSVSIAARGAFADSFAVHRTLVKSAPLALTAIGLIVAWRGGMFNIGGEGQLLMGALACALIYRLAPNLPFERAALLAGSAIAGGTYALIAAILYTKRGVNIVIGTILLNFIAMQIVSYAVRGPLQEPTHSIPQTASLPRELMFGRPNPQTDLHWGVLFAPVLAVACSIWLFRTAQGFRIRLVGSNFRAARAARIDADKHRTICMGVSGAIIGLAGGIEFLGTTGYLYDGFSPGWGFLGIPVALLGGLHPLGALASAFGFGAIIAGTKQLEAAGRADSSLVFAIQGAALLLFMLAQAVRTSSLRASSRIVEGSDA